MLVPELPEKRGTLGGVIDGIGEGDYLLPVWADFRAVQKGIEDGIALCGIPAFDGHPGSCLQGGPIIHHGQSAKIPAHDRGGIR